MSDLFHAKPPFKRSVQLWRSRAGRFLARSARGEESHVLILLSLLCLIIFILHPYLTS